MKKLAYLYFYVLVVAAGVVSLVRAEIALLLERRAAARRASATREFDAAP
jgi:hypothetical protein